MHTNHGRSHGFMTGDASNPFLDNLGCFDITFHKVPSFNACYIRLYYWMMIMMMFSRTQSLVHIFNGDKTTVNAAKYSHNICYNGHHTLLPPGVKTTYNPFDLNNNGQ